MNKYYLYCRVSTDDKNQEFDRQLLIAQNYSSVNNIEVAEIFCEKISGGIKATQRKEFEKMFNQLQETDTILVSETSRLGRNYLDCFEIIDKLVYDKECNIIFISNGIMFEGGSKLDPYKWLTLSQMLIFDEFQKRQIGYMTSKGLQAKKALGVKLGRKSALDDEKEKLFEQRYQAGATYNELMQEFGISKKTVANYINKLRGAKH